MANMMMQISGLYSTVFKSYITNLWPPHSLHILHFFILSIIYSVYKEWIFKIQLILVSSLGIIALESRKINLYNMQLYRK